MYKCKNCIFPDKCINFGKEFCKTKSTEVKYKFVKGSADTKIELTEDYRCTSDCFECRADKTCLASDDYVKEIEGEDNDQSRLHKKCNG